MADSTINGLEIAQTGYMDLTDQLVIQKSGETQAKQVTQATLTSGWNDMLGPMAASGQPAASAPTPTLFQPGGSGNVYAYAFALNEWVFITYHPVHDMKQGATMYPHMHWTTNGTSQNAVKWQIEYSIASRSAPATFAASQTINIQGTPSGTAYDHYVTEGTGIATPEIDSIIQCRVIRLTNGGSDNGDTVFGLAMDWHYPTEGIATKNRNPNFYT